MISTWPCPQADGSAHDELAVLSDRGRSWRLLILPALFDESNKLRRLTVDIMQRLDAAGVDSMLPDLPGCNESLHPLEQQTLSIWRAAAQAAANHFTATHVLTIRAGALLAPAGLPGWHYAPVSGSTVLRPLLRGARVHAREAGHDTTIANLQEQGRTQGIDLAGYSIGSTLFCDLEEAEFVQSPDAQIITQESLGEAGLWLRAEPDMSALQSESIAEIISKEMIL